MGREEWCGRLNIIRISERNRGEVGPGGLRMKRRLAEQREGAEPNGEDADCEIVDYGIMGIGGLGQQHGIGDLRNGRG